MAAPARFVRLLDALAAGHCTIDLWGEGAEAHYASPKVEEHRCALIRASIDAGDWKWPAVPASLEKAARAIRQAIG
jgi:hypothetical protein